MKLLLVSANAERTPYPVFPIGLAYLATPLAAAGHTLHALDLCFSDNPAEDVAAALAAADPDVVIVSVRNIDNVTWPGSRSYLAGVRDIITRCAGRTVVVGGSGFSLMPREVLDYLGAAYGVVGEGEDVINEFVARIGRGESPAGLPGVVTRGDAQFVPPRPVSAIGTPDRRFFSVERYRREGGMANIQTKRGCPFTCIYCTYPALEGCRVRTRAPGEIVAELKALVEQGIDYVYFVDDIFNYPADFAADLCRAMVEARLPLNWAAFINPAFVTPELLETMIAAGCDAVEFGTDSGSPTMLRSLGKSFGTDHIREASRLCREAGVDFTHYLLFGGPGETEETILESFSLMDEVAPTAVIAMTGIRIFPGTPLFETAVAEGVVNGKEPLLEPIFYISRHVGERLAEIVTAEAMKRRNWIAPGLEINMSDSMMQALRHFPVRGPLWKLMKRLGRNHVKPLS